jgi:hypothetical protein
MELSLHAGSYLGATDSAHLAWSRWQLKRNWGTIGIRQSMALHEAHHDEAGKAHTLDANPRAGTTSDLTTAEDRSAAILSTWLDMMLLDDGSGAFFRPFFSPLERDRTHTPTGGGLAWDIHRSPVLLH